MEQVADLDEGLLDPAAEQAAREHLASCAQCTSQLAQLSAVKDLLAADGAASPVMPTSVAARIDATLAAQRRHSRLPMVLVAAASVAVLGAAVGIGVSTLDSPDASVAGSAVEEDSALSQKAMSRRGNAADKETAGQQGAAGSLPDLRSRNFDEQVRRQLASSSAFTDRLPAPPALSPQTLACVRTALKAELPTPPLVYPARLDGRPVQLVLSSLGRTRHTAWAVACTDPPRVLAKTRLPVS
jgi:hypothetical protein